MYVSFNHFEYLVACGTKYLPRKWLNKSALMLLVELNAKEKNLITYANLVSCENYLHIKEVVSVKWLCTCIIISCWWSLLMHIQTWFICCMQSILYVRATLEHQNEWFAFQRQIARRVSCMRYYLCTYKPQSMHAAYWPKVVVKAKKYVSLGDSLLSKKSMVCISKTKLL